MERRSDVGVSSAKKVEPARFRQLRGRAPPPLRLSMCGVARHHYGELLVVQRPHVAKGPIRAIALYDQRLIIAAGEELRLLTPQAEQEGGGRQLRSAVLPIVHQRLEERRTLVWSFETRGEVRDGRLTNREIDRPSIVRIDEIEVPQLAALINVGHAGRREFADGLNEAVLDPETRHAP